jgi:adenylate cyclase
VRCAIEVQNGMVERNAGLPPERRIEFRVGIHSMSSRKATAT